LRAWKASKILERISAGNKARIFIFDNTGKQRDTQKMNSKIQIDVKTMFFNGQAIRNYSGTQYNQGIGYGIETIIFLK